MMLETFSTRFRGGGEKPLQISNFMKIRSKEAELFHVDGQRQNARKKDVVGLLGSACSTCVCGATKKWRV